MSIEYLTPREAAAVIGCCPRYVRIAIHRGLIRARKIGFNYGTPGEATGFYWGILRHEAEKFRDMPRCGGFPRGAKRCPDGKKFRVVKP